MRKRLGGSRRFGRAGSQGLRSGGSRRGGRRGGGLGVGGFWFVTRGRGREVVVVSCLFGLI